MSDITKLRGVQAFHTALLAHRDKVRETFDPTYEDVLDAFSRVSPRPDDVDAEWEWGWNLEPEDVTALRERLGPADAVPYLRAVWGLREDFNKRVRGRALSYLMDPWTEALNPMVGFLADLADYAWVTARWVLDNRDALREVWIARRYKRKRTPFLYKVDLETVHLLVSEYPDAGVPLDLRDLETRCAIRTKFALGVRCEDAVEMVNMVRAIRADTLTLTAAGMTRAKALTVLSRDYPLDADDLPVTAGYDAAGVAARWTTLRDAGVPLPLSLGLCGPSDDPVADVLDAVNTFRVLNADGGFPFSLAAGGLGVPETTMTDDAWNAWCHGVTDTDSDT
ncbi:Uncharacterised protein [Mycobacteroides abscessus subsp. abscessus]|uniref:hypothetical protein n=1 Tax=Mycobacteroides abscessus TaxID=36809 RepID=UPI0009A6A472|nr:hypothetical protein [Mycobacteroides abscessus]SKV12218.1 Uncharacterised protein [Mycobacteroides abscessus subsp. abscessus]